MAQLSRTYQAILILVAVLALAWFTVLHNQISGGSGGSSSSSSAPSAHTTSGASGARHAGSVSRNQGAPSRVYHGPVPGLHGLSKDIQKAHEAVSTSNGQSRRLESTSGATPSPSAQSTSSPASTAQSATAGSATKTSSSSPHSSPATGNADRSTGGGSSSGGAADASHADSRAVTVSGQLKQGKVVLLLFWNSKSSDDQAVHTQVQAASRSLGRRVAADFAKPSEVSAFGTVTRDVGVLQTPTLLVINQKGLVTTITGLTDAFSIEQAVREAR